MCDDTKPADTGVRSPGERPPDPIEPLLDPFTPATKRWIAVLLSVSAVAWLLAVNGFPPITIDIVFAKSGPVSPDGMRSAAWQAIVALIFIVAASAGADMIGVRHRRRWLQKRSAEYENQLPPPEERFLVVLTHESVWPILATRLGLSVLLALLALAWTLCASTSRSAP